MGPPLAFITSNILRGIESTKLINVSSGIAFHSLLTSSQSSSRVSNRFPANFLSMHDHKFSMGFKSGLKEGNEEEEHYSNGTSLEV